MRVRASVLADPQGLAANDVRPGEAGVTGNVLVRAPSLEGASALAVSGLATSLASCGGGGGGSSSSSGATTAAATAAAPLTTTQAARFLLQAQFSASDSDINAVQSQGLANWLSEQYATPISTTGWSWLTTMGYNVIDTNVYFFNDTIGDNMIWNQLITSPDGVRKRLSYALANMFVVSFLGFSQTRWNSFYVAQYWDLLNANVFGNYRDLLQAITLSVPMGDYLNTRGNQKENLTTGSEPDENYAREVMQLFSIGLFALNIDGSVQTDSTGAPIPTYAQADVSNLARVFTGYSYDFSTVTFTTVTAQRNGGPLTFTVPDTDYIQKPLALNAAQHSTQAATFLGVTIPANTDGATALKTALDTIFNHPNVGPFFGRQMIQHLVTSNPSPGYISRVAAAFNNNGSGVRGDLKAVWTAILTDAEATTLPTSPTAGKLREPVARFVQFARTVGVTTATGVWGIGDLSDPATGLSQSPFRSPSVFNFFRPGYVPAGTAIASANLVAPEFQLVGETSIAGYLNVMLYFMVNGISDVKPNYSALLSLASTSQALLDWFNLHLSANQISATTIAAMKAALDANPVTATSTAAAQTAQVQAAAFMVMAASEYLIQK